MSLPELQDGATSNQKVEYVSHALVKRGKGDYIELTYKRLDGQNPGAEMKTGAFVAALDQESKDAIKAKGQFVITKTKSGNFWNLTKVADVSTYVEKATSGYTKGGYSGGTKSGGSSYNTAGIKVGAVLHDSVALAGTGATILAVKKIAEELLKLSYELEANVNAGKYEPTTITKQNTNTPAGPECTPVIEETSLDNIDF